MYGSLESTGSSSSYSTDNYQGHTDGSEYFNETTGRWEIAGDDYQNIEMDSSGNQYTHTHESEFDNDYFVEDQWWVKGDDWVAEDVPDISELKLVSTDSIGATLYTGQSQDTWSGDKTYILPEGATEAILVTENWGGFANLNNDWGSGSQAVYAVEAKTGGGYTIAIKESFEGSSDSNWQTIDTDDDGVIDWSTQYWGNIKGKETLFNQDLDGDESTGIDKSSFTTKTTDTGINYDGSAGDRLQIDSNKNLYILTTEGDSIAVVDEGGGWEISLDETQDWGTGSFTREAAYVEYFDSEEKYYLAVKETNSDSWDENGDGIISDYEQWTDEQWVIYTIQSDGGFNWNGTYGANITSYEEKLNVDINNDGALGLNLTTLEAILTDTDGVTLKRGNGELFIIDGDNTIQITEEHGGSPQLERSDSWQGGSFSSTAYAAVKNSDDTYSVAIKFEESFSDDFFHKEGNLSLIHI